VSAKKDKAQGDAARLPTVVLTTTLKNMQAYGMLGLVLGVIIVIGGLVLIVLGFTGSVDITFASGSSKGHIATGSLGIVVTLVGGAIVFFTKPRGEITAARVVRRSRRGR
jgi:hypothetical protein